MIRRLLHALAGHSNGSDAPVPFTVKCPAGHVVRGLRQRRHQVVSCAECGVDVFVLPRSPFPDRNDPRSKVRTRRSPWRRPLVAAALAILIVASALAGLFVALTRRSAETADVETHVSAAEQALSEGRLRRAVDEFAKARELALERPDTLAASQLRTLTQEYRETSLVADLLSESLAEILIRAARSHEDEWKAQFEKRYLGPGQANAVVFDAEVRRGAAGQYHLDWELKAGDERARLEIGDLAILHDLPLDEPRRLLFGARLGSIAREQNGVWVVRFEPSSGVLLTDRRTVVACYPGPVDAELLKRLDEQRKWMEEK
ncbi:MAG TPA: hypothetical protein VKE94_20925 [Gemmataceae bacterium]|nr:hypothetical protein [Gemmataceae bacterium]